jgi:hypothetical protein
MCALALRTGVTIPENIVLTGIKPDAGVRANF